MFVQGHNYSNHRNLSPYRTYAYARDIAILENFAGREFTMYADGKLTSDIQNNADLMNIVSSAWNA